jgi:tetratricopeptide (TPR) repeat protein
MSHSKEFSQEEADRYNYLFSTANQIIDPYMRIHGVEHSKADIEAINKAIAMYDEAIQIHPESWQSMWLRGKAYQALGSSNLAYASFKESYSLKPDNPDVVNEYLLEATNLNKIDEALVVNKAAVAKFPDHLGLQANYALVLILAGQTELAISQGQLALKMAPSDEITKNLINMAKEIQSGKRKQPSSIYELTGEM